MIDLGAFKVVPLVAEVAVLLEEVTPITVSLIMLIVINKLKGKDHLQIFVKNEHRGQATPAKKLGIHSVSLTILARHDILTGDQPAQTIVGIGELIVPKLSGFPPNLCD